MFPRVRAPVSALFLASAAGFCESAQAEDARALLDKALAVAEAHKDERYAFTIIYSDQKSDAPASVTLRFDPRLPEGSRWALLSPAESALTKEQRKQFKNLRKSNDADDSLIYDRLRDAAAKAQLVSEDAVSAQFAGPINDPKAPEEVVNSMEITLQLDKPRAFVRAISIASKAPFKPAAIARVDRMEQTQTYEPLIAGGPAILRGSRTVAIGEAMFRKFDQQVVMEYRDFERVGSGQTAAGAKP